MKRRLHTGLALGALLGSTAFLSALTGHAETPPAAAPPPQATPAPPAKTTQSAGMDDRTKAHDKAMAAYSAFFDAKLAGLHAGLQLTPEQAPLWAPVESAIRDLAKLHGGMRHGDEDGDSLDPLHQLMRTSDRMIKGGQAIKALADAAGPLVATLTADQKERLSPLLDGLQPKRILLKAFNVSERSERADWDEGDRGYDHRGRHHEDFESDHQRPRYRDREEGRDDHSRDFRGGRDFHGRDFGDSGGGDHERRWDHGRDAERDHSDVDHGRGDRDAFGGDERGPEGYPHHQDGGRHKDSEDERT